MKHRTFIAYSHWDLDSFWFSSWSSVQGRTISSTALYRDFTSDILPRALRYRWCKLRDIICFLLEMLVPVLRGLKKYLPALQLLLTPLFYKNIGWCSQYTFRFTVWLLRVLTCPLSLKKSLEFNSYQTRTVFTSVRTFHINDVRTVQFSGWCFLPPPFVLKISSRCPGFPN